MANKAGTRALLGEAPCGCCGQPIPVRESETGTVNASCPWCEVQTWAKRGTKAHALLIARIRPGSGAQAPQPPAHGTAPKAQPQATPKAPAQPAPAAPAAPARPLSPFHF